MKKIISIALTFVLLLSTFVVGTVSVSAEKRPIYDYNENCTVFYEYDKTTKTLTISGQGEYMTDQGDYAFSGEGGCKFDAFYTFDDYRNKVEKVVFEEGIVNVGGASFVKFKDLKTVVLPTFGFPANPTINFFIINPPFTEIQLNFMKK